MKRPMKNSGVESKELVENNDRKTLHKKKSLWITEQQDKKLKQLEKQDGLKQSEHMRRALDDYFKNSTWRE